MNAAQAHCLNFLQLFLGKCGLLQIIGNAVSTFEKAQQNKSGHKCSIWTSLVSQECQNRFWGNKIRICLWLQAQSPFFDSPKIKRMQPLPCYAFHACTFIKLNASVPKSFGSLGQSQPLSSHLPKKSAKSTQQGRTSPMLKRASLCQLQNVWKMRPIFHELLNSNLCVQTQGGINICQVAFDCPPIPAATPHLRQNHSMAPA